MRTGFWLAVAWTGAAVLIFALPFLMQSWTGFFIALAAAGGAMWAGFWLHRKK